jgi:hypothetical protein
LMQRKRRPRKTRDYTKPQNRDARHFRRNKDHKTPGATQNKHMATSSTKQTK